jgi:hypothetical protein
MGLYPGEFLNAVIPFLAVYYAIAFLANLGAVVYCARRRCFFWMVVWGAVAVGFAFLAGRTVAGDPLALSNSVKQTIDGLMSPASVTVGFFVFLVVVYLGRAFFVLPAVAWVGLNAAVLFFGASLTDQHFTQIVAEPDNVPIVAMVFLLGFFTWLSMSQAVKNDRRLAERLPPREAEYGDKVFAWPDVVYLELIGLVVATIVLVVWSLLLRAPLQGPADPALTPNPSKAPWYFVGLQEMLTFFDPWLAGVTIPVLIVLGLMAVPYLDFNPKGSGYYTIRERRFAYVVFQFGFLQLWILLILIGTFMRGPNWGFFGLYEVRDPDTVAVLTNVSLSQYVWNGWLGRELPQVAAGSSVLGELGTILWREWLGLILVGLYFVALPIVLAKTVFRSFYRRMGRGRYTIMVLLLLMMIMLPVKMVLHWTCHLSYLVSMPEYFLNF